MKPSKEFGLFIYDCIITVVFCGHHIIQFVLTYMSLFIVAFIFAKLHSMSRIG